jgi:hypothetical protein
MKGVLLGEPEGRRLGAMTGLPLGEATRLTRTRGANGVALVGKLQVGVFVGSLQLQHV